MRELECDSDDRGVVMAFFELSARGVVCFNVVASARSPRGIGLEP